MVRLLLLLSTLGCLSAAAQAQGVSCTVGKQKTWNGGFVLNDVLVQNASGRALDTWSVALAFENTVNVTKIWGALASNAEGRVINVTSAGEGLDDGESARFGFKAQGQLDGVTCRAILAGPTPSPTPIPQPTNIPTPTLSPTPPPGPIDTVFVEDFESYNHNERWLSIDDAKVQDDCRRRGNKCLRVAYRPDDRGSPRLQKKVPIAGGNHYILSYDILFEDGFEFVRGGKLPGLSPSTHTTGCRAAIPNGWSARPMWRANGTAQGYYYGQDRVERCGDGERSSAPAFTPGVWQKIELDVKLNSERSSFDGHVILRVDGAIYSENRNLNMRGGFDDETTINHFFFSTFYGGADPSWAPSKTTYIRYDNFEVMTPSTTVNLPSLPLPTSPPSAGARIHHTLNELPSGFHDRRSWRHLWSPSKWSNGTDEGRVFVDDDHDYQNAGKSIRVLYPSGKRTSSDSGAQWHIDAGGRHEELYLAYWVKFNADFDFVLGGKLPGLSGSVSFQDRTHEWKGRLMWREEGRVEFYMHFAHDRERWWWNTEGFQAQFVPGQWHHIEMRFRMNTPGKSDGLMEGWFDGYKAARYAEVEFRGANEASSAITKVFFSTFFGGSSGDRWNATKDEFAWFDDIVVSANRIGVH